MPPMIDGESDSARLTEQDAPAPQEPALSQEELVLLQASWEGPLPPPQVLQAYESIVPGAADRILRMAEAQSESRLQTERTIVNGDSKRAYLGILAGFILSMVVIGGGIYLIATGHDWAGASLIGLNLVGLAGVFVYGSKNLRDEQPESHLEE